MSDIVDLKSSSAMVECYMSKPVSPIKTMHCVGAGHKAISVGYKTVNDASCVKCYYCNEGTKPAEPLRYASIIIMNLYTLQKGFKQLFNDASHIRQSQPRNIITFLIG